MGNFTRERNELLILFYHFIAVLWVELKALHVQVLHKSSSTKSDLLPCVWDVHACTHRWRPNANQRHASESLPTTLPPCPLRQALSVRLRAHWYGKLALGALFLSSEFGITKHWCGFWRSKLQFSLFCKCFDLWPSLQFFSQTVLFFILFWDMVLISCPG